MLLCLPLFFPACCLCVCVAAHSGPGLNGIQLRRRGSPSVWNSCVPRCCILDVCPLRLFLSVSNSRPRCITVGGGEVGKRAIMCTTSRDHKHAEKTLLRSFHSSFLLSIDLFLRHPALSPTESMCCSALSRFPCSCLRPHDGSKNYKQVHKKAKMKAHTHTHVKAAAAAAAAQ